MYGSRSCKLQKCNCHSIVAYMWLSKNVCYEIPYNVKGIVKYTGSKETSKDICKDRKIGTRKARDMET